MDAVEFIKEQDRMCEVCGFCDKCPLSEGIGFSSWQQCNTYITDHPEKTVAIVEKWSKEHPQKTRFDDFKEKYPNAEMRTFRDGTKIPMVCARNLGYTEVCSCIGTEFEICINCWNQPVE